MKARIFQFPPRPGLTVQSEMDRLSEALAEWREKQEQARRTEAQLRWYRRHDDDGPEAA